MSPGEELKGMLERIAERALDNMETFGFHLPVCFGLSPSNENFIIIAEPSGDPIDIPACKQSVLHQTQRMISDGKLRAVAFATVVDFTFAKDDGGTFQAEAIKILLDHVDEPGYAAYLTFEISDGKAVPGQVMYQELPERFFSPSDE